MKSLLSTLGLIFILSQNLYAAQSVIIDAEGYACMGDDKSRKQTEQTAFQDSKRMATESATTYIQSETHVKDSELEQDLVSAYANAQVKVIKELFKEWYTAAGLGECFRVKLSVEVIPDEKAMAKLTKKNQAALESDPSAPLSVRVWTDRKGYKKGERMRIYLKANKPFYGRVIYKQADGSLVQLLPNPFREQNYFNGGVVYELPSGDDRFDMEVSEPYGAENITVYASTAPIGTLDVKQEGGVYSVLTRSEDVAHKTRGINLIPKTKENAKPTGAEFDEAVATVTTGAK